MNLLRQLVEEKSGLPMAVAHREADAPEIMQIMHSLGTHVPYL